MELPLSRHARPFQVSLRWSQENHCGAVGGHIRKATTYSCSRERFAGRQTFWCAGWWVGKLLYVHRRMWPALVSFAGRFSKQRLAALNEVHTPAGKHRLLVTPFPDWVPTEVLQAAQKLTEKEAASQLAVTFELNMNMRPNHALRRTASSRSCSNRRAWRPLSLSLGR